MRQEREVARWQMRPIQAGIMIMVMITALFHLYLSMQPAERFRIWFVLNFVGYVGLWVALYWPSDGWLRNGLPVAIERRWIRYALISYTLLTIICWLVLARPYDPNDVPIKLVEILLICLLLIEDRQTHAGERGVGLPYQRIAEVKHRREEDA